MPCDFATLARERRPDGLDTGAAAALRWFAKRLLAEYDAVRAAMILDWRMAKSRDRSTGSKALKRQMYG